MTMLPTTLCFIWDEEGRCLMLRRARPPHRGQWNAPGGKIQGIETPEQACRREVLEETGLVMKNLQAMGSVDCIDALDSANTWRLHLFCARYPNVLVPASPEGIFAWLDQGRVLAGGREIVHNIPLILPLLVRGIPVRGVFEYRGEFLERYNISLTNRGKGLRI